MEKENKGKFVGYKINVSNYNKHVLATQPYSIKDKKKLLKIIKLFSLIFPESYIEAKPVYAVPCYDFDTKYTGSETLILHENKLKKLP